MAILDNKVIIPQSVEIDGGLILKQNSDEVLEGVNSPQNSTALVADTQGNIKQISGSDSKTLATLADIATLSEQVETLQNTIESLFNYVGAIIISASASFNPNTTFGGTWEIIKDRFLLGAGDIYNFGATGGSANAVVVQHRHTAHIWTGSAGIDGEGYTLQRGFEGTGKDIAQATHDDGSFINTHYNGPTDYLIDKTGVDGVGKNMPPYLVVKIWRRTAL